MTCDRITGIMHLHLSAMLCRKSEMSGVQSLNLPSSIQTSEGAGLHTGTPVAPVRALLERTAGASRSEIHVASDIRRWVETCFSTQDLATEDEIQDLIHEASEAARDDYGADCQRVGERLPVSSGVR